MTVRCQRVKQHASGRTSTGHVSTLVTAKALAISRRAAVVLSFCLVAGCRDRKKDEAEPTGQTTTAAQKKTIAVVPKGTTHEFWKAVHAGSVKAARGLGVDIIWKGPVREDDRDEQIKVLENFVSRKVDGIVVAPLDDRALVPVLRDASNRKIPVVVIDSAIQWQGYVSYVATDNVRAGALAAGELGRLLKGAGNVIVMRYQEGSASTMERERGFLETLKEDYPRLKIASSNQYGGATTESAFATAERLLSTHADVQGVFCPNESTTFGMLRALQGASKAGKLRFVGFDASPKLVDGLRNGEVDGLIVQNPFRMGELGLTAVVDHDRGKSVEKRIDTGATLVTRENMNEPTVRALLSPDLSRFLE